MSLDELLKHLEVGRSWKEIGCNHVVTITEIESGFANNIMVEFKSDCCLSSSPLRMFLKDFTPVPNNDVSKSVNEIDISLNSVDDVNTTFKVGDKVYVGLTGRGAKVTGIVDDEVVSVANENNEVLVWTTNICHATQENYEMLSKLYPNIEFELPPQEITGNDLCCAMLRNKHNNIMCQVDGDETNIRIITLYTGSYFYDRSGNRYSEVVPIDTKGIPLTEDVLYETI